jgi:hypothetical protein
MHKCSFIIVLTIALAALPSLSFAHCDTMDGPVVKAAQIALSHGDITPVLKWIKTEAEAELRNAFENTLTVRKQSKEAQQLADQFFFETLVRLHRAGEGAPYMGSKPSGEQEPIIAAADQALESSQVNNLSQQITTAIAAEIARRYEKALAARKTADNSVAAGREFVEAYVSYVHFVEHVYQAVRESHDEHGEQPHEHTN